LKLSEAVSATGLDIPLLALPAEVSAVAFMSDLHLCPEMPHTAAAFEHLLTSPDSPLQVGEPLFILGDLFEAWIGDDSLDQAFEARCGRALAHAAQRRSVYVMHGNRDFLLGARFFAETGCQELPDRVALRAFGQTALLCHGDELCLDDVDYQRFRALVRQPAWQSQMLSRPWAERQALARQMRAVSRSPDGREVAEYADADVPTALAWMAACQASTLVHGHTHRPGTNALAHQACRHVLSDWDLEAAGGAAARAELLRWTPKHWQRVPITAQASS
jgi:UDP-2,3-diacylglucosamine hydrolase